MFRCVHMIMLLYYIMMVGGKSVSHDNKAVIGQSLIIILSVYILYTSIMQQCRIYCGTELC